MIRTSITALSLITAALAIQLEYKPGQPNPNGPQWFNTQANPNNNVNDWSAKGGAAPNFNLRFDAQVQHNVESGPDIRQIIADAQKRVANAEAQVRSLTEERDSLKKNNNELKSKNEALNQQNNALNSQIADLNAKLDNFAAQIATQANKIDKLSSENASLNADLSKLNESYNNARQELAKVKSDYNSLAAENAKLRADNDSARAKIIEINNQITDFSTRNQQLVSKLADLNKLINGLNAQINELREKQARNNNIMLNIGIKKDSRIANNDNNDNDISDIIRRYNLDAEKQVNGGKLDSPQPKWDDRRRGKGRNDENINGGSFFIGSSREEY